jgi:hypothetical protein
MSSTTPYVPLSGLYPLSLLSGLTLPPPQSQTFTSMSGSLKGSAGRLGRMAASGNKVAILKLAGMIIGAFLVLYYLLKLFL